MKNNTNMFIPNSFQMPNAIVDEMIIASMKANDLKVYLIIMRKTMGWNKEWDFIPVAQIQELTGIKKRQTVYECCARLEDVYGLIESEKNKGKTSKYKINRNPSRIEVVPKKGTAKKGGSSTEKRYMVVPKKGTASSTEKGYTSKDTTKTTITKTRVTDVRVRNLVDILKSKLPDEYKLKIKDISINKNNDTLKDIENKNIAYQALLNILEWQSIEQILNTYLAHIKAELKNDNGRYVKGIIKFLLSYKQIKISLSESIKLKPLAVEYTNGLIEDFQTGECITWMNIKVIETKYKVVGKSMLDLELKRRGIA